MFCAATAICISLEQHVKRPEAVVGSASSQQNLKHGRKCISSKLNHGDQNMEKNKVHEKNSSGQATERKSPTSLVDSSCIEPSAYFSPSSRRHLLAENQLYPLVPLETKNVTDPKAGGKPVGDSMSNNETPLSQTKYVTEPKEGESQCYLPINSNSDRVSPPLRMFKCVKRNG